MNIAAAYASLTVDQLKAMMAAAHTAHRREMEEVKVKHATVMEAWRQALVNAEKKSQVLVQKKESDNAALRRELHSTKDELERANILLAEQTKRLVSYERVAELEQKLHIARKLTTS